MGRSQTKREALPKKLWVPSGVRYPSMQTQRAFQQLWNSGIVEQVMVMSNRTHFGIHAELIGGGTVVLVTTRGNPRVFLNPGAALLWLKKMGVKKALVEFGNWDVELAGLSMRLRPDVTAKRLKKERFERESRYVTHNEDGSRVKLDLTTVDREDERKRMIDYRCSGIWPDERPPTEEEMKKTRAMLDALVLENLRKEEEEEEKRRAARRAAVSKAAKNDS
jgi:hypothetical protein